MTLRHIAIIVSAMAISLTIFNATRKPVLIIRPIVAEHNGCVNKKQKAADIIAACTKVLARDVDESFEHQYYKSRALAHRRVGDYDKALSDIDAAITLQPKNVNDLEYRAYINNSAGEIDAAEADFETAIALRPTRIHTYLNRAKIYKIRGEYGKALRDYHHVLEMKPSNYAALNGVSVMHFKMQNYDQLVGFLNETAPRWKKKYLPYFILGLLHVEQTGDYEKALAAFTTVAQLEPEHEARHILLAMAHFKLNDDAQAKIYIEKEVEAGIRANAAKRNLWETLLFLFAKHILGVDTGEALRGLAYSFAGRPEEGAQAFARFVEKGGVASRNVMNAMFQEHGVEPISESRIDGADISQNLREFATKIEQVFSLERLAKKF